MIWFFPDSRNAVTSSTNFVNNKFIHEADVWEGHWLACQNTYAKHIQEQTYDISKTLTWFIVLDFFLPKKTQNSKMVKKTTKPVSTTSLLYPGMGYDSKWVTYFANYKHVTTYDTLPSIAHYKLGQRGWKHTKSKACFFRKLRKEFGMYQYVDGHLEFELPNGGTLVYHYDVDATKITIPEGDILLSGYLPTSTNWMTAYREKSRIVYLDDDSVPLNDLDGVDVTWVSL